MKRLSALLVCLAALPAAEHRSFKVDSSVVQWQDVRMPGAPAGMKQRLLHNDTNKKVTSAILLFPKGFRDPRHYHTTAAHSLYILRGRLRTAEGDLTPGMFIYSAVNERHGPFTAVEETEMLFYTDGPLDYFVAEEGSPVSQSRSKR